MSLKCTFSKVLVANRGEIAVRVIRTAKSLGFKTVAVYSEADANAPHVIAADEAVCIGAAAVGESYLKVDNVIKAAKLTGADAIHPGYGFLSENADFARTCQDEAIEFIGPPTGAISLMGSKRLSKIAMINAEVPCIPGYEGEAQDETTLINEAKRIGFPVMIKASAGGGGRGMRLVHQESELSEQIKTARSEAENAFGNGELILEKAVIQPRHIEIQVFADKHGNVVYLGERDCSIQRRHQKVVEEAPSPFVDEALRARMGEAACQAARSCQYVGAGTVEFLVDADKNFYFLEMNTRLQVEHPVTELVTGTDLVAWQLNVAAGAPLPLTQEQINLSGHAIEVRLYAEDPRHNFMPQTGHIKRWSPAQGDGIRIDSGIATGQMITPHYDPMLAKIIAYGSNREEARRRLAVAIEESTLLGVPVNSEFLAHVIQHDKFIEGEATTAFIEEDFGQHRSMTTAPADKLATALTGALLYSRRHTDAHYSQILSGWQNSNPTPWPYELRCGESVLEIALTEHEKHFVVSEDQGRDNPPITVELTVIDQTDDQLTFIYNGVRQRCEYLIDEDDVYLRIGTGYHHYSDLTHEEAVSEDAAGSGKIIASMDGAIMDVLAEVGDRVVKGQSLVVLEAMKMEHPLKSDVGGTVESIQVQAGDQVKIRQLLVTITPDEE
ncbi:acetyl/propionyl/methylcrotonyl-CoA carboxylase subunit alpha [Alkalimarinus sediminis]|uniref:Biotin carboxylase n=1 Tax=Alkalimarinus sediminis TaxID=1632866 RepID=A0A9E8HJ43_9ALTE|nr:acetyl/propionyl/methylcrotonyl-CoA carboxylase subunit alpha [Alkalimarinus sediminis]UZW73653.1 acetyl/propionyl/methylcrotonyl-CoA carboxylase subunit alpha [Alkalimarinus sediminis]